MSKMSVSNLYVVLQPSFVENTQILCNDRDCPQGLLLHKFFFFPLEDKIGGISGLVSSSSWIACHSGKKR